MKPDPEHHFFVWTVTDPERFDGIEKTKGHSGNRKKWKQCDQMIWIKIYLNFPEILPKMEPDLVYTRSNRAFYFVFEHIATLLCSHYLLK